MSPVVFERDRKRASSVMIECPTGRSGTLRTSPAGKSPVESGVSVSTSGITAVNDGPDDCDITIADDSPGIPKEASTPIEAQTETRLQHGRGLGLWQLHWRVDTLNGERSFVTEADTTVRITLPNRRESNRPG